MGLIIGVVAVVLLIDFAAATEMYEIAKLKGHYEKKYFWWCFLVPAAGYPMVIALPK